MSAVQAENSFTAVSKKIGPTDMLTLDFIQTLAVGAIALFIGIYVLDRVPLLRRYNIPAAVFGGLVVALAITMFREFNIATVKFDTTLQAPLMTAFFTSIGLSASLQLLKTGSRQALVFLGLATFIAVVQSVIGMATALLFDQPLLLGVLMGPAATRLERIPFGPSSLAK
jgi:ESS family glutamate:Na+ symporter